MQLASSSTVEDDETLGGIIDPADLAYLQRLEAEKEPRGRLEEMLDGIPTGAQIATVIVGILAGSGAVVYILKDIAPAG